jgi:hypothetical protein
VRERFFACAERGLQDAHAARVAVEFARDDRLGGFISERGFARHVPTVDRDARALHGEIGDDRELAQFLAALHLQSCAAAIRVRLGV